MPFDSNHKKITRIVLSPGGAKACAFPHAYLALCDTGVMDDVTDIAGSSAGALAGSLMAIGILPEDLTRMLSDNFATKLGKKVGGWVRNPEGVSYFTYDGKPLEKFIREEQFKVLTLFFRSSEFEEAGFNLKLYQLRDKILNETDESKRTFTFGDLALLHEFFPQQFKRLTVTAVNARKDNHQLQIFNAVDTPDVDIARACRASGSVPTLFERVPIELNGKTETFVDAGLLAILPVDYFDYDDSGHFVSNQEPENTLILALNGSENEYVIDRLILNNLIDLEMIFDRVAKEVKNDVYFVNELLSTTINEKSKQDDGCFSLITSMYGTDEESEPHTINLLTKMSVYLQIELNCLWEHLTHETDRRLLGDIAEQLNETLIQIKKSKFKELEGFPSYLISENATDEEKEELIDELIQFFLYKLKSEFYSAGFKGDMISRLIITTLGDIHLPMPYSMFEQTQLRRIQRQYKEQIVSLQVGDLTSLDFDLAHELGLTVIGSRAYSDVLEHVKCRGYNQFPHDEIIDKSVVAFEYIYKAMLIGAGRDPRNDKLLIEITQLHADKSTSPEEKNATILKLIKSQTTKAMTSCPSVALSLSLKYARAQIKGEDLFKATYIESFKHSGWFSLSNITGESIYFTSSLEKKLDGLKFFSLYKKRQNKQHVTTRTDKIFDILKQLEEFNLEANEKLNVTVRPLRSNLSAP